jgi:hypothetical protein
MRNEGKVLPGGFTDSNQVSPASGQQHLLFRDRIGGKETQWEGKDGTVRRSGKADERKSGRDTGSEEAMGVSTA